MCRRGFRPGEVIELAHTSLRLTPLPGCASYLEAVERALRSHEAQLARLPNAPDAEQHREAIHALQLVKEAELRRLRTGEWCLEEAFA
ncbi:hypothetical protein U5817_17175 [Aromatoleum evansii]|uniref:Uncharacterized protein n=1 Tax=Aromatoleum evansii TaxID=59406 RepID=A0ABZ1AGR8_AROEV|nr:hypothetical protein U5817_17175 [Aromatoleum evansii]